mgnify:FL=1
MAQLKNMQEKGGYIIDLNPQNKTINIRVEGVFTPDQATQFHTDYEKQVNSISAGTFDLIVDCTDMKVINQDMIPALTHSLELYKSSNFKKIKFTINGNPILKMQLNRIIRSVGIINGEIEEV